MIYLCWCSFYYHAYFTEDGLEAEDCESTHSGTINNALIIFLTKSYKLGEKLLWHNLIFTFASSKVPFCSFLELPTWAFWVGQGSMLRFFSDIHFSPLSNLFIGVHSLRTLLSNSFSQANGTMYYLPTNRAAFQKNHFGDIHLTTLTYGKEFISVNSSGIK